MDLFAGKTLLITGGTGSFGTAMLTRLLRTPAAELRVFSRDEKKQEDMRRRFDDLRIRYYIGDVRDTDSLDAAFQGVDYLFHSAALKQVPSCDLFPLEAVKTNILGTENVLEAAARHGIQKVICLSTDKAAYPINAMGISKAMMEKVVAAKARVQGETGSVLACTRYGNVLCSRGSVVPLFVEQALSGAPITVTDPHMTRFLMSLEDAVELVLHAFRFARTGDLIVPKSPACAVGDLAQAVLELFCPGGEMQIIGPRLGEKRSETLLTAEERSAAVDEGNFFRVPLDRPGMDYHRTAAERQVAPYTSDTTRQLCVEEIKGLLLAQPYLQEQLGRV